MPTMDPDNRTEQAPLFGDPPNPIDPPPGCRFHTRCTFAEGVCSQREPVLTRAATLHDVACLRSEPGSGHTMAPAAAAAA